LQAGGSLEVLQQHNADHAEETLSVFLAPDGNLIKQKHKMVQKAKEFSQQL
jgi:hypothetical protein